MLTNRAGGVEQEISQPTHTQKKNLTMCGYAWREKNVNRYSDYREDINTEMVTDLMRFLNYFFKENLG